MSRDHVNLAALDLNLITALQALLEHRSVSEAAVAVGRTQSALSHSLARLRAHFHDPILVRDGWAMHRTPLAERLKPRVDEAARAAQAVFAGELPFDPASSTRAVRIAAPDLCTSLFTPFIAEVSRAAPRMSVRFVEATAARQAVLTSQADIGLAFGHPAPDAALALIPLAPLGWQTFAPAAHPYTRRGTPEAWAAAAHIVVGSDATAKGPVEKACAAAGLSRRILCYAPNFSAALALAAQGNALFTTLGPPFRDAARMAGLEARGPPFAMPAAPAALIFRRDFGDRYHAWLRAACTASMPSLTP